MAYPVTPEFAAQAKAKTQRSLARVDITSPSGTVLYSSIATVSGEVTEDSSRAVRRSCVITFVDKDGTLTVDDADDLLAPLGNEMRVYKGLIIPTVTDVLSDAYDDVYDDVYGDTIGAYADVADEWVPLGVFGISRPKVSSRDGGVTISVEGYDRARRIQRAKLTDSYRIANGTDLDAAIAYWLINRWSDVPNLVTTAPPSTLTHKAVFDVETDPWQAMQELAEAHGSELYFNEEGIPVRRLIPDPTNQAPVASYQRDMTGLITELERVLDDEDTYSGVIVTGESTSAATPVRAVAWDNDSTSPTWVSGKFGQVPFFYTSPHITTSALAVSTAAALLPRYSGFVETAEWEQVPNAALQAGDLVEATDARLGLSGFFSLESVTTGLRASAAQRVRTKARRLVPL